MFAGMKISFSLSSPLSLPTLDSLLIPGVHQGLDPNAGPAGKPMVGEACLATPI